MGKRHQQVHGLLRVEPDAFARHAETAEERVLEDSDDGGIVGRTHNLKRNGRNVLQLRLRHDVLWHVHIHLISVKIRIVGLRTTDVEPERIALLHDFDNMTHHRHSVKRRLSVEQHRISIHHMPVDNVPREQLNRLTVRCSQRNQQPVFALNRLGTREHIRPIAY